MTREYMSYEEFLVNVKKGIVTEDGSCPVTPLLLMLQGRWKSRLLYELCTCDAARFGQLKRSLPGITNTMLTKVLRELEEDGLVNRKRFIEAPPHVEYSLTEMGRGLLPVFYAVMNWAFSTKRSSAAANKGRTIWMIKADCKIAIRLYHPLFPFSSHSIRFRVSKNLLVAIIGPKHRHPSRFHQNIWRNDVWGPSIPSPTALVFSSSAIPAIQTSG